MSTDQKKVNLDTIDIKLPNNISSILSDNKYVKAILTAFYMNTRNVNVNQAYDYINSCTKEEKERLKAQLSDYEAGKNIEFDVAVENICDNTDENQFKIPDIKVNNQTLKPFFLKKIIKQKTQDDMINIEKEQLVEEDTNSDILSTPQYEDDSEYSSDSIPSEPKEELLNTEDDDSYGSIMDE